MKDWVSAFRTAAAFIILALVAIIFLLQSDFHLQIAASFGFKIEPAKILTEPKPTNWINYMPRKPSMKVWLKKRQKKERVDERRYEYGWHQVGQRIDKIRADRTVRSIQSKQV